MIERAEAFQHQLETGEAPSRAFLARAHGLTRARVTQTLNVLKLHPGIIWWLREMAETMPPGQWVTEKKLRSVMRLPHHEQLRVAVDLLPGFRVRRRGRRQKSA